jgi:hypothetical protein
MLSLDAPGEFGEAQYNGGVEAAVDMGGGGVGEVNTEERCDIIINDPGNGHQAK